jgi:hypothetical protein
MSATKARVWTLISHQLCFSDLVTTSVSLPSSQKGHWAEDGCVKQVGRKKYVLKRFHFHWPSDEKINGKSFDMSLHLVLAKQSEFKQAASGTLSNASLRPFGDIELRWRHNLFSFSNRCDRYAHQFRRQLAWYRDQVSLANHTTADKGFRLCLQGTFGQR